MSEWGEGKGEDTFLLVLVVVVGKSDMTGERDSAGRRRETAEQAGPSRQENIRAAEWQRGAGKAEAQHRAAGREAAQ